MGNSNKYEKPEGFIGWKSDDHLLEVIGINGRQGTATVFKVICHKCKEDKELFPDGYFISVKSSLLKGNKPCGCSKRPKWSKEQFLILARRAAKDRFIVHGFAEEFHGVHTKLNLECLVDGHRWTTSITHIINHNTGCSKCRYATKRTDEQEALNRCKEICEVEGYKPIGFIDGYKNQKSRFEYLCPKHLKQSVSYSCFVDRSTRCRECWKEKQKEMGSDFYGYFPTRKDEQDFLYILNFEDKYIKVGRSFDVERRIGELISDSKIKKIYKLRILTATHQQIYDLEQKLHNKLKQKGFQHVLNWSNECFINSCLHYLFSLLDNCNMKEVKIYG